MEYWESKFRKGGSVWGYEPAESALIAVEIFRKKGFRNILIPGFGYGRNGRLFLDAGFKVTGIEISGSAIGTARENNIGCKIYQGSVTSMPFDNNQYDAIFCYALIHLLNKSERSIFLRACFSQLKENGSMIFVITSKKTELYRHGKMLSRDRYELEPGLKVFFYDPDSIKNEFSPYGLKEFREIDEPVKFITGAEPLKLWFVVCEK